MTRLDTQFNTSEAFRLAVADFRGDGRPDYFYQATLLYSDTATPPRVSLAGGITTLSGIGFNPRLQVTVAGNNGTTLSVSASQIQAALPAGTQDGTATIQVTDPVSGGFSQMIGALTYGAAATDLLLPLQAAEPSTPVGSQAANPIRLRAVAADGVTPVSGATIAWSATNGLQFSACSGTSSCSVLSDEAGESSSWVTPTTTGPSNHHHRLGASVLHATADATRHGRRNLVHARLGRADADTLGRPRCHAGCSAHRRSARLGRPLAERNRQLRTHHRHSHAFGRQCNHQRLGIRHHHRPAHESQRQCAGERVRSSKQYAVPDFHSVLHPHFALDTTASERIVAVRTDRAGVSAAGDACDRRLRRRESSAGSERSLCHHARARQSRPGRPARWRRRRRKPRHPRNLASAGSDRSR